MSYPKRFFPQRFDRPELTVEGLPASSFQLLVAALAATMPTYLIRFEIFGIPTTVWEIALYLVVGIGLVTRRLSLRQFWDSPLRAPLILLALASLGGLIPATDSLAALGQWKALWFDAMLFLWLLLAQSRSRGFPSIWNGYLLGASAVAAHAILVAVLGGLTADGRVIGVYAADPGASPNYLALFLAPAVPLAVFSALERRGWTRVLTMAAGLLMLGAVILSGSRAGLGALGLALLVGGGRLASQRWPQWRIAIWTSSALIVLLTARLLVPSFLPQFDTETVAARVGSSNNIRWEIWRTTLTTVIPQMSPLGVGWGNYQATFTELTKTWVNYPEYVAPLALHPHNFFLTTLVTTGWLGFVAWFGLVGRGLVGWWRRLPQHLPIGLAFLTWLIQGLVDTTYYKNDLAPLTWLLLLPLVVSAVRPESARRPAR